MEKPIPKIKVADFEKESKGDEETEGEEVVMASLVPIRCGDGLDITTQPSNLAIRILSHGEMPKTDGDSVMAMIVTKHNV